jgi:hypothetical protein
MPTANFALIDSQIGVYHTENVMCAAAAAGAADGEKSLQSDHTELSFGIFIASLITLREEAMSFHLVSSLHPWSHSHH